MKVLLQEQDEGMRAVIRPMLANLHVTLIEAKNPWDVLGLVARYEPDVVLLSAADIYCSAQEVPEVLASRSVRPRLLLHGATAPRNAQVPRISVDGYLPYPFDAARLWGAIDQVLQASPAALPGPAVAEARASVNRSSKHVARLATGGAEHAC